MRLVNTPRAVPPEAVDWTARMARASAIAAGPTLQWRTVVDSAYQPTPISGYWPPPSVRPTVWLSCPKMGCPSQVSSTLVAKKGKIPEST